MPKKVVIDCDPGVDDALAILLAIFSKELDVLGITTVNGNVGIDLTTENALKIVEKAGSSIPVYRGMKKPLKKPLYSSGDVHGQNGLGGITVPKSKQNVEPISATDYLIQTGRASEGEITLITLGPLTNIAVAIQKDPEAMSNYKEIISMGGGVGVGNITPVAEFNYWVDPEAAKIVFNFDLPITMLGLNATHQTVLTPNDFHFMRLVDSELGEFLAQIHTTCINAYWEFDQLMGCVPHDSLAVAVAADPSLVETVYCNVEIATDGLTRGQSVADVINAWEEKRKNSHVGITVDSERFRDFIFLTLFSDHKDEYDTYKRFLGN
ncbi:purine nucleosidase [Seinonella peptonophila]|uniref:Purine nucleosidase n=1 Tax=Seinonella peptonophila TaxID=112248 RepID=A0A1M5B9X9_9BACL|nr:nucleoside hydrolase [Seinonella peptonophila]SHF39216.1 purine nucleosidase [Seinonella peptonophila]